ncbi:hypothetical protein [Prosthecobacter sp.]|uniref:hypothetical protein n=1 Tax=Prosthecobacter sp. TaxID=1965333 RepID=UPI002AB91D35|nr:hypothetical protein [Prosthecobacter sp.]MDZ4406234.1 hypothetical protein [Prosthecobacter sp.]
MLEKLNFSDLLRYGFSGGALLLALALTRTGFDAALSGGVGLSEGTGLALVAMVAGSFIYTLHRALLHRPIVQFIRWCLDHQYPTPALPKSDSFLINTYKRDYVRWVRRSKHPNFQRNMDLWSSQIHFLYGCAWAIGAGAVIGRLLSPAIRGHDWHYLLFAVEGRATFYLLVLVSLLSLLGALFQDYIAQYYDRTLLTTDVSKDLHEPKPTDEPA